MSQHYLDSESSRVTDFEATPVRTTFGSWQHLLGFFASILLHKKASTRRKGLVEGDGDWILCFVDCIAL